ncbi:MAG TPA: biotin--[acetyl-CoA-carboxylase] ligase [Pyrinomonadaceae bacterium]|nr:biotin--[acetyl-CoA-carboxylase] ligase [Pyrinomonadaceae bacterium]
MNINILRFDSLGSTNTEAANQARQGADEGLCVIAREQSAGRGRHGRTWVSEPDSGLYFSIVLRPKFDLKYLSLITLMAGVAVYDTLKEFRLKPDIKWVNDVLIGEKKISGILAETVDTQSGNAVIVGIGINLKSINFPDEIAETATSIQAERSGAVTSGNVEGALIKYLSYWYETLNSDDGPTEIIQNWRQRSSYFSGKAVRVTLPDGVLEGTTDGLEENGALRVKTGVGSVTIVQAGDVERLREV